MNPSPSRPASRRRLQALALLAAFAPLFAPIALSQPAPGIHLAGRSTRDADPGAVLLTELNCTACHSADDSLSALLPRRGAPVLGAEGLRLEPAWLASWLDNPVLSKPGNPMPHLLHGLSNADRATTVDSLVHYLVSIQPPGEPTFVTADRARLDQGRDLFHSVGCVACHVPADRPRDMPVDTFNAAVARAVPLGDLERKYPGGELIRFLKDPVKHRPGGRMPSLALSDSEARAIATYLLRAQAPALSDPNAPLATVPGLKWEYFEGRTGRTADLDDGRKPVATGESDELAINMARREGDFAVRFSGAIEVPADGEYTFWINSDDGATLDIGGKRVVDNDGEHAPQERSGKLRLARGPHSIDLRFFQNGGGWEFKARWAGPGFDRQPIPGSALKHYGQPMLPIGRSGFTVDPARAAIGRTRFAELNCVACHQVTDPAGPHSPRTAKPLKAIAANPTQGCLADRVPSSLPQFHIAPAQRAALRKTLTSIARNSLPSDPASRVALSLSQLGCLACHQRDGVGGPGELGTDGWFKILGEADLGDEGRIPPHLEKVGGKLRREWLVKLLNEGSRVRPYMATRMPLFGSHNIGHLPAALESADVSPQALAEPTLSERDSKFGRKLVGRDGLSCVACHTFSTFGSLGIPALGLDHMHERLRWDWFRRYLPDPAALRPGTRMPSFWPEGRAANAEILDGDPDAQIRSIWAWMAAGPKADVPAGLIRSKQEIAVGNEAVIYRNFIEGAGSRAIAVGYPEHANLAFDANQMRLALLWQGAFIDMSRHSTDRGVGFEPPLGDNVVRLPDGPPFASLSSASAPWPKPAGRSADYQFLGYSLDDIRRPTFRYRFKSLTIEDFFLPKAIDVDISLTRILQFKGTPPPEPIWFRVAVGNIQAGPDETFILDGKVRLRFPGSQPVVVGNELRVPIKAPGQLIQEITW